MKNNQFKYIVIVILSIFLVNQVNCQSNPKDSSFHPYHVNYWVTVPIIGIGLTTNYIGIPKVLHKDDVTQAELLALNKDIINGIDSWALKQDATKIDTYENYSNYGIAVIVVLPAFLMFDKQIRHDWSDILLMYMETMSITPNIYEWSFLGPTFQNRFRPVTYYTQLTNDVRKAGNNRNSFYSGHVASVSASTFFMVKVFSDYNPDIGGYKYLLYAAATVPPLILGYFRIKALKHFPSDVMVGLGVGALCGILIPEFHRIEEKNIKLSFFSSPEATGITLNWQPDFLK
jgi:membrane-associated phospholipid phosphatase